MPEQLLSTGPAAAYVGVSPDTIRRWAAAGLLPVAILPSGHRRFRVSDLDAVKAPA